MEKDKKKPIFKKWWFWVIIIVVIVGIAATATSNNKNDVNNDNNKTDTSSSQNVTPKWKQVAEFEGTSEQSKSNVFALKGGDIRVKYDVTDTSAGGNAMIYVLKEGETATEDASGNVDVKQADAWPIGTKSSEETVTKSAGNYYIYVNSSSISHYKVTIDEKQE